MRFRAAPCKTAKNKAQNHPPQSRNVQIDLSTMKGEKEQEVFRNSLYHFRITAALLGAWYNSSKSFVLSGELAGIRTQDPRLKRALLYQLSYELSPTATYLKIDKLQETTLLAVRDCLALRINLQSLVAETEPGLA